ncbi:1-deoxy-D-xylulose-5-phosphate reductoisomerase [Mergibacter septicus]|uniref:1-deoxy-D-xylulose-5-phosphate reductoisomerase n=1 Tax=Mergibacter septicus TaxID=221402 RepID=UPI001C78464B|nr:1-deoxy-D-xylulose-5-phosphate reductoisomerase [Mergibacter septicus]QDJ13323.1 1-deoxy-D-xylulose-5-phosphate reductoisomerase [Mergibacter septicus]
MKKIVILGSTGSIGCSTLSVVAKNPEKYQVFGLVAGQNINLMLQQCLQFNPSFAAMADPEAARQLAIALKQQGSKTVVLDTLDAASELAVHTQTDIVMAAIVGAAGLLPTLAAVKAGKRVLLANKETLVTCGQLFIDAVKQSGAELLPVDSEHNAIFQVLPLSAQQQLGYCSLEQLGITKIVLTGSGGPFRNLPLALFDQITPAQAVAHPNWSMGQKISVDSATMMNKGLEYIEARWLFNAQPEQMEVIIHPQSIIHSMVRYVDGSVLAQMGEPDMCTPIAQTLAYPARINAGVKALDFYQLNGLTFIPPDFQRYPNLKLAIEASQCGQVATTAMNAANEVAVAAFLQGQIKFTQIAEVNYRTVELFSQTNQIDSIEMVLEIDQQARIKANRIITGL